MLFRSWGALKGLGQKAKAAVTKAGEELGKGWKEDVAAAEKEEAEKIVKQAREKARQNIDKIVKDVYVAASQHDLQIEPDKLLKNYLGQAIDKIKQQTTVQPEPEGGIPQTKAGIGGSYAARAAE